MNKNNFLIVDYESTGANPWTAQPTEIAAIVVDPIRLEPIKESIFNSLIKPSFDEEYCKEYNLEPPTDRVLKLTHKTVDELKSAPDPKTVFLQFVDYCKSYKTGNNQWGNPIRVGHNIRNYDDIITNRLCGYPPYKYGEWDSERQVPKFWHPVQCIDTMNMVFTFIEGRSDMRSTSMDNLRRWFGLPQTNMAHTAIIDVIELSEIFCRFMKLIRSTSRKVKFENALADFNVRKFLPNED